MTRSEPPAMTLVECKRRMMPLKATIGVVFVMLALFATLTYQAWSMSGTASTRAEEVTSEFRQVNAKIENNTERIKESRDLAEKQRESIQNQLNSIRTDIKDLRAETGAELKENRAVLMKLLEKTGHP